MRWENEVGRGLTLDKEGGDCGMQVGSSNRKGDDVKRLAKLLVTPRRGKGGFSWESAGNSIVVVTVGRCEASFR